MALAVPAEQLGVAQRLGQVHRALVRRRRVVQVADDQHRLRRRRGAAAAPACGRGCQPAGEPRPPPRRRAEHREPRGPAPSAVRGSSRRSAVCGRRVVAADRRVRVDDVAGRCRPPSAGCTGRRACSSPDAVAARAPRSARRPSVGQSLREYSASSTPVLASDAVSCARRAASPSGCARRARERCCSTVGGGLPQLGARRCVSRTTAANWSNAPSKPCELVGEFSLWIWVRVDGAVEHEGVHLLREQVRVGPAEFGAVGEAEVVHHVVADGLPDLVHVAGGVDRVVVAQASARRCARSRARTAGRAGPRPRSRLRSADSATRRGRRPSACR